MKEKYGTIGNSNKYSPAEWGELGDSNPNWESEQSEGINKDSYNTIDSGKEDAIDSKEAIVEFLNDLELITPIKRILETEGYLDIEKLSDQERALLEQTSTPKEWLIHSAECAIASEKRGEALAFLSGRTPNGGTGVFAKDAKSIIIAIKKLSEARKQSPVELRADATSFAQEVYNPTLSQQKMSAEYAGHIVDSISGNDILKYIGTDVDRTLKAKDINNIAPILDGLSSLFNNCLKLDCSCSAEFGDVGDGCRGGYYDPMSHKIMINHSRLEENIVLFKSICKELNRPINDQALVAYVLSELGRIVSHEFFHVYQRGYKDENDDDRALKYALNLASYVSVRGEGREEDVEKYRKQLLEREADAFGKAFREKLLRFLIFRQKLLGLV